MKRIVVGAMARSGSTWTFNAVRKLAVEAYGVGRVYTTDAKSYYKPEPDIAIEIIKAHDPVPALERGAKIVTCLRDLRDAFCSGVAAGLMEIAAYPRRGMVPGILDGAEILFVQPSTYWLERAAHVVRFESMMVNKAGTLATLGTVLFPQKPVDMAWCEKAAIELEVEPSLAADYDPAKGYLFGDRHRQGIGVGGYLKHMPWSDADELYEHFKEWFAKHGYAYTQYEEGW